MIADAIAVQINAAQEALNAAWRSLDTGMIQQSDRHLMSAAEAIHRARDLIARAETSPPDAWGEPVVEHDA